MVSLVKRKIKGRPYYYLVWMKRKGKKVVRAKQIYVGTAEKISQLLSRPLPKFISSSYGELALLLHVAEQTNFVNITNKYLRKEASIGDYLLLPIINRLLKPKSKASLKQWHNETCLPIIWNKDLSLSSQSYWYYLNRVKRDKIKIIWKELLLNVKEKLKLDDSTFLFDPTNFFTYIEDHKSNELPRKGKSKQNRNDKNQLSLSMFIGEQSEIPYDFNCYAGNIHDSKHFAAILPDINEKISVYSKEKITLIFDKGNNSPENLKVFKNYYFVGALQKNKEEARDLLNAELKFCYENKSENKIYSTSKEAEIYGLQCKVVISYNEELKKKQLHSLEEKIAKTSQKFEEIKEHKYKTEKAAINAMIETLPKKQNPFDYEVIKEGDKFSIKLNLNEEKVAWYRLMAGKNIVFTNHLDWNDERIIKTYRSMYKIENQFKLLHGALLIPIKPVYHWTDQKIEAHIFLCMVALLFARILEYVCRGKIKGSFRQILDFAGSIRIALVYRDNKPKLVFEELDAKQQALMETFSLSRFAKN